MVRTELKKITPRIAAELLTQNSINRPMSVSHVRRLAESMKRGEWDLNGTTIKVSTSGRLLDGQHRLTACVDAGVPFDSLVVYGLEDEAFATIDQGAKSRKISDVLSIEAGANMKNVTAALFALHQMREYQQITGSSATASAGFSAAVAREMLHRHPGIVASVGVSNGTPLWRNAYCACLHYVFGIVDVDLASEFAEVLRNGSSIGVQGMILDAMDDGSITRAEASQLLIQVDRRLRPGGQTLCRVLPNGAVVSMAARCEEVAIG